MKSVPATVVSCVDDNEEAVDLGGVEARQNLAAYLNVAAGQTQWAGADGVAGKGWQGMAMVLRVCLSLLAPADSQKCRKCLRSSQSRVWNFPRKQESRICSDNQRPDQVLGLGRPLARPTWSLGQVNAPDKWSFPSASAFVCPSGPQALGLNFPLVVFYFCNFLLCGWLRAAGKRHSER